MKRYLVIIIPFVLGMLLGRLVHAQSSPSAMDFVSDALKHSEGVTALDITGNKAGAVYVPLRVIDKPVANALDVGVGVLSQSNLSGPQALVSARINILQLANGLFGTKWFTSYSHGLTLPTLFIGPAIKAEFPPKNFTWKKNTYVLVGIPFGSVLK